MDVVLNPETYMLAELIVIGVFHLVERRISDQSRPLVRRQERIVLYESRICLTASRSWQSSSA
jgi:hypothetical protein